jgi:hypothetical protein
MTASASEIYKIANTLLEAFIQKATEVFGQRAISLYKFGSLGEHGDFSLCSDVDVALFLDKIEETDPAKIIKIAEDLKKEPLAYADRLSLFWSSYDADDFVSGKGRFPALDRIDLIDNAVLIAGVDKRHLLSKPKKEDIISESGEFILSYLLSDAKCLELLHDIQAIPAKGARYFSKSVLFPVRLMYTLDISNQCISNKEAVTYFKAQWKKYHLPAESLYLVECAYEARNRYRAEQPVAVDEEKLRKGLIPLYIYCLEQYCVNLRSLNHNALIEKIQSILKKIDIAVEV